MKKLLYLFLIVGITSFGQEEIKIPELDTENSVYTLEFSPDSQNKEVVSAYMKGTTEKDSLRFWAEGTIFTQKIMVTVFTENKNDQVKVDIVKNHWEDSKLSGITKNGSFQESFDTAGKFGIVITSKTPNIPFYLAVWTGGERVQNLNTIYRPVSGSNSTTSLSLQAESSQGDNSNNILMYVLIGALSIIIVLLALMVFRKKKGTGLTILLLFFAGQQMMFAGAQEFSSPGFGGVGIQYPGVMDLVKFASQLNDMSRNGRTYLDLPGDADAEADMNPSGGPGLPSSCIPSQFANSSNGNSGPTTTDSNNSSNTDLSSEPFSSSNSESSYNEDENINYEELDSFGRPVYDRNNERIDYNVFGDDERPKYDVNGDAIEYRDPVHNDELDSFERPVYDRNNQPIDYPVFGDDKRPKYDINGNLIQYAEGETEARPALDANKKPIEYDNYERPKYDNKGNPINYQKDDFTNPPKRNKDNDFPVDENENPEKTKVKKNESEGIPMAALMISNSINNIEALPKGEEFKNIGSNIEYAEANLFGAISTLILNENDNEAGCKCLEREYNDLNKRRMNLERLRIIYAHAMKKINAGIAFGDGVSAVHGVSALVWQNQKMIILKESIPTLNKAYDDKYAEMIKALEENLREIDRCEAMLGYENWYNHAGFIYFQFMADKYKRD
ncbi:MAG: hypothetical protein ABJJ05_08920 [Maribacter litoralis]|uniref:hypothetical protein n=1 Tax=Maribacter litoralis TaxID=2059726 RepID=UPI00329887C7